MGLHSALGIEKNYQIYRKGGYTVLMIKALSQDEKDKKIIDKIKTGIAHIDKELVSGNGFSKETNIKLRKLYTDKLRELEKE